jgi:hypothetical protein
MPFLCDPYTHNRTMTIVMMIPPSAQVTPLQRPILMPMTIIAASQNTLSTMFSIAFALRLANRWTLGHLSVKTSYAMTTKDLMDYRVDTHQEPLKIDQLRVTRPTTPIIQVSLLVLLALSVLANLAIPRTKARITRTVWQIWIQLSNLTSFLTGISKSARRAILWDWDIV